MLQEVLTYIILTGAVFLALFRLYKTVAKLRGKECKTSATSSHCAGCDSDCALRELPTVKTGKQP